MKRTKIKFSALILCCIFLAAIEAPGSDNPKQTPANTVSIHVEAVKPQVFAQKTTFFIDKVVDRSGKPQPLLAYAARGGVFFDREPGVMVREALENSFRAGEVLAADAASANVVLDVYIFEFGLSPGSGFEFFTKVELNVVLRNNSGFKSDPVSALGTSIQNRAILKSNIQKNVTVNVEEALHDAVRSLVRGTKFRDTVLALQKAAPAGENSSTAGSQPPAPPANRTPAEALSKGEILKLLKSDTPQAQMITLVKERGISFVPTSDDLAEIRAAGGKDELIHALEASKPR